MLYACMNGIFGHRLVYAFIAQHLSYGTKHYSYREVHLVALSQCLINAQFLQLVQPIKLLMGNLDLKGAPQVLGSENLN